MFLLGQLAVSAGMLNCCFDIVFSSCSTFLPSDFGEVRFSSDSAIFIDEGGLTTDFLTLRIGAGKAAEQSEDISLHAVQF